MRNLYRYILLLLISTSCTTTKKPDLIGDITHPITRTHNFTDDQRKDWYFKDIIEDSIPGISLEKAYQYLLQSHGEQIIVAVLDTKLDIHHEDIREQVWINQNEIPNNQIDDDNNGYIDDINGWNFLGNVNGAEVFYSSFESIRIIRKYDSVFNGKLVEDVDPINLQKFELYQKAKEQIKIDKQAALKKIKHGTFLEKGYPKSKALLKTFFPKEDYSIRQLDSLYKKHKDSTYGALIYYMGDYKKHKLSKKWIDGYQKVAADILETSLNSNYNEREIIGDISDNKMNTSYGNNKVWNDSISFQHAIKVSGTIAAKRKNDLGAKGISDNIKLMSLCVASSGGDEHDRDISSAIRYAVDNGARVINMSFGKPLSLHKELVDNALQYAATNNVLVVRSAGNNNKEIDLTYQHYPNDYSKEGKEISNNVISVGSTSYSVDKTFKSYFSNYSKTNVDIFAPGQELYTTLHHNEYGFVSGTSLACSVVSGVAALILSYYPDLSAAEVKEILMKSGVSYNIDVEIKQEDGTKKMVPFSELSKSGKIVNAYNALLLAEQVSKGKN